MEATASTSPVEVKPKQLRTKQLQAVRFQIESAAVYVYRNRSLNDQLLDCTVEHLAPVRRLGLWSAEVPQRVHLARAFITSHLWTGGDIYVAMDKHGRTFCSTHGYQGELLKQARDVVRFSAALPVDQLTFLGELRDLMVRYSVE
jgi:hypothetical protein